MNVWFLFGPNLGALGRRDPDRYGTETLQQVMDDVTARATQLGHEVQWRQSEHEGELIEWCLAAKGEGADAIVCNPGALAHYSYALRDAIAACEVPVIEVHQTNLAAREPFRHTSVVSAVCRGTISGLGVAGYHLALEAMPWIIG